MSIQARGLTPLGFPRYCAHRWVCHHGGNPVPGTRCTEHHCARCGTPWPFEHTIASKPTQGDPS